MTAAPVLIIWNYSYEPCHQLAPVYPLLPPHNLCSNAYRVAYVGSQKFLQKSS